MNSNDDWIKVCGESQPIRPKGASNAASVGVLFNVFGIDLQNVFVLVLWLKYKSRCISDTCKNFKGDGVALLVAVLAFDVQPKPNIIAHARSTIKETASRKNMIDIIFNCLSFLFKFPRWSSMNG